METTFTLTVNGQSRTVTTDPQRPLLEVLREEWQLTGTKYGCGEGQCGACTVIMGGKTVKACVTPISRADRQTVLTIESLATGEKLHPVQEAFVTEGAVQCGYCTPGMIMSVVGLLQDNSHPTEADILSRMEGQICRCCGYPKLLKAVKRAAAQTSR
jgi:aerobic carbon-monoxide dehydrogenase small subunit